MSNEPPENAFPRTKIQSGGFRRPSQAIRKIHIAAGSRQAASFWCMTDTQSPITTIPSPTLPLPCYLPICWHSPPSGVRNSEFFASIFQRFDFRARNNIVWEGKLYCLTPQTILFGSRNNIFPGTFCLFFENRMYSFLKSKAFFGRFVCNHSRFISRLSDFQKAWVSRKRRFGQTCIAHPPYQFLFVIRRTSNRIHSPTKNIRDKYLYFQQFILPLTNKLPTTSQRLSNPFDRPRVIFIGIPSVWKLPSAIIIVNTWTNRGMTMKVPTSSPPP